MAYSRKKIYRRRSVKARRYARKGYTSKKRRYSMAKRMNSNVMHVMLRTNDTIVANQNLGETLETYRFGLQNCLNANTYATMWDQYRINKVVITWTPIRTQMVQANVEDVTPSSTTNIPSWVVAKDFDDLTPTSYTDTRTRFGSVVRLATQGGKMIIRPACLSEIYQSTLTTAYSPNYGKWIDTANNSVPHYGVRFAMEAAEPSGQYALECKTKIYVSFKNRVI